jgi:hypothetical protein
MLAGMFTKVFERLSRAGDGALFLMFLGGSLLIRFPFFFRDYVDRDESTFILMAQSLVDGHLPYTQLWDLKPPLLFLIFALPIWAFGKSMVAIRLVGLLAVSGIAYYTYALGREAGDRVSGLAAGLACMFLMSLGGSVQGVMSEHFSMLFLLPGLLLLARPPGRLRYFLGGAAMALAVLCKSNLAVALPVLAGYLVIRSLLKEGRNMRVPVLFLAGGGTLVLMGSVLPYLWSGQGALWWDSVIRAPLAYSGDASGFHGSSLGFCLMAGLLLWLGFRQGWLNLRNQATLITGICLAGILLAFFKGGRINGHYLLQFYPLALVLLFGSLQQAAPRLARGFVGGALLWLAILPVESYREYADLLAHYRKEGAWYNGEGVAVPHYLRTAYPGAEKVFFLEYHIGYWFLDALPPSAVATHPSNICRSYLYPFIPGSRPDPESEIQFIMEDYRPEVVVRRRGKSVFDPDHMLENAEMESYLEVYYRRDTVLGRAEVYARR